MEDLKTELYRKSFHLGFGVLFAALIYFGVVSWPTFLVFLIVSVAVTAYIKKTGKKVVVVSNVIDLIGRKDEYPGIGVITFVAGTLLATILFTTKIAAASMMILAVGDSVSCIIGTKLGKTKTFLSKHKKLEGFFAGLILSFLAATPIVGYRLAFFGSLIAMLAEIWDKTSFIDDNILMPLIAGVVMSLI